MAIPEEVWRIPLRILLTVVLALLLYLGLKLAFLLFQVFQELFVLLTISIGHIWSPRMKRWRIHPYICRSAKLDNHVLEECYRFHMSAFEALETLESFEAVNFYKQVVRSYSHILMCRDRDDGSLRGTMLFAIERKQTHTIMKIGMLLTHSQYRGGPWNTLALAPYIMRELILHPLTPLYIVGKVSTYKSYILLCVHREFYPRYDRETPELYKRVAEEFVNSVQSPHDIYNRNTQVLKRRVARVKKSIASPSEEILKNPHVKFFIEQNSDWQKGDQLVTVLRLSWLDVLDGVLGKLKLSLLHTKNGVQREMKHCPQSMD